jgi:hypothetical protein
MLTSVQPKPKFDLKASLSKGMPNTKVGPKVAIPPAKAAGAAAAAAGSPAKSPAKPVKSPVKKADITRVTAGPFIRIHTQPKPQPNDNAAATGDRASKSAAAAKEAAKARQEANRCA